MNTLQLKLFTLIRTWEDIKNNDFIISVNYTSGACYTNHYTIQLNKKILDFVTVENLKNIIINKFMGYYGGRFDYFNISDNVINLKYVGYND